MVVDRVGLVGICVDGGLMGGAWVLMVCECIRMIVVNLIK